MKKPILVLILLAVSASVALAAQSRAYYFTMAMLQSVYQFNEANEFMQKSTDTEDKAAAANLIGRSVSTMKKAKSIIQPWLNDADNKITRPADAIDRGLDVFLADAATLSSFLERAKRGENVGEEEGIAYAMEGEKRQDAAYLNMGSAIANYSPEGLTKKERGQLLMRIFILFDKELKKYRFHPTEVTEVVIGISALESRLQGKDIEKNPYFKMLLNGEAPFPEK